MRNPSSSSATQTPTNKTPCCSKVGLKRGPWTPEEDELLANYINKEGEGRWRTLPKRAGLLRCGKSCRLRWMNYLRPSVKRGQIAPDEEDLILRLHRLLGNRWSLIAGRIPGRTDNEIKNYWNTHLSKKLISQGIDPRTHKPLNTDDSSSNGAKASSSNAILQIPKSNPRPTPSVREETANNENRQIQSTFDQYQTGLTEENRYANMPNSDGSVLSLRDNYYHGISNEEDADGFTYGTDDVFSSFLNSLINEDVFATQHQLQPQPTGNIAPPVSDVALIPSPHNFGFGTNWESTLISSTFSQNDLNTLNEHVE